MANKKLEEKLLNGLKTCEKYLPVCSFFNFLDKEEDKWEKANSPEKRAEYDNFINRSKFALLGTAHVLYGAMFPPVAVSLYFF